MNISTLYFFASLLQLSFLEFTFAEDAGYYGGDDGAADDAAGDDAAGDDGGNMNYYYGDDGNADDDDYIRYWAEYAIAPKRCIV